CDTPTFASTRASRIIARTARPSAGEDARPIASRQLCLIPSNTAPILDALACAWSSRLARCLCVELAHAKLHVTRPAVGTRHTPTAVLRDRLAHRERGVAGVTFIFIRRHTAPRENADCAVTIRIACPRAQPTQVSSYFHACHTTIRLPPGPRASRSQQPRAPM